MQAIDERETTEIGAWDELADQVVRCRPAIGVHSAS